MRYLHKKKEINGVVRLIGDIHGNAASIPADDTHADHYIFLGDVGLGFRNILGDEELSDMYEKTHYLRFFKDLHTLTIEGSGGNKDVHIWFIRGNHDNPGYWKNTSRVWGEIYDQLPPEIKSHIHFIEDETISINGEDWFVLGGGVSIDIYRRTEGYSYWKDEEIRQPVGFENANLVGILSHVGPKPPSIKERGTALVDRLVEITGQSLRDSIDREARILDSLYQQMHPKKWIYAHWHVGETFTENGCSHVVLDAGLGGGAAETMTLKP